MSLTVVRVAVLVTSAVLTFFAETVNAGFEPAVCPPNWIAFGSRCWFYSGDARSTWKQWAQGDATCQESGGRLLSIHSEEENNKAYELCKDNSAGYPNQEKGVCWIGLYQIQGQSGLVFQWVDGSPATTTFWAPNEPNNVGSGGEDCVQIWDRNGKKKLWNDEPCTFVYPYLCGKTAQCPAGAYESQPYELWNGKKASCEWCPEGTYRASPGGVRVESCSNCAGGRIGGEGETTENCAAECPRGFYCPAGTSISAGVNEDNGRQTCPPGTYGASTGLKSASQCQNCAPGFYCPGNGETTSTPSQFRCDAGQCGFQAQSSKSCSQKCPAGYFCQVGSACPGALLESGAIPTNLAKECGGSNLYCPPGSLSPRTASAGYYTIGGDNERTRTAQTICEPGYYCSEGVRRTCPGGTYVSETGASSEASCLPCEEGYVCPQGDVNTGPRSLNCYTESFIRKLGSQFSQVIDKPAMVYCPRGSSVPRIVSAGHYTLPDTAPESNRHSQTPCLPSEVCIDGVRSPLIDWDASTDCKATRKAALTVLEMSSTTSSWTFPATLNARASPSDYTLSYRLNAFTFHEPTWTSCIPSSPMKNQGIFTFSNGDLRLTRDDLNFEVCLPILDVAYVLQIQAQALRATTDEVISTITCEVLVTVDDDNDKPEFYNYDEGDGLTAATTIYHRQIMEKVDRNVPVAVCDSLGALFNCPLSTIASEDEARLLARDEDDASVLRYSIVSGDDGFDTDVSRRPFKIDPCTGLVSAKFSNSISFKDRATYTYEIRIEDDGNGGRYSPKEDFATLVIHVIDVNDPPQIDPDQGLMTIQENQLEDTPVSNMIGATDEDQDTLSFLLVANDGDAFKIVNNQLLTTRVGAQTINFESSKRQYFLTIEVQDGRGGRSRGNYVVRVLDMNDPPRFVGPTTFYVKETAPDTAVCVSPDASCAQNPGGVSTIDEDTEELEPVLYSLDHPNFVVDPSTGVIRTRPGAAGSVDFENTAIALPGGTGRGFTLEVIATSKGIPSDSTPKSTSTLVTVYIVDVNEPPAFESGLAFRVLESWPVGAVVPGELRATDPDNADSVLLGEPAPLQSLSFSNDVPNEYFTVQTNQETGMGEIKVTKSLDFEALPAGSKFIPLTVRVEDNGGPTRARAVQTFNIQVVDANEPPSFANPKVKVFAPENQVFTGELIGAQDEDANEIFQYTVLGGNGAAFFEIQQSGNQFRVVQRSTFVGTTNPVNLNYELSSKEWTLNIQVEDSGPSARIATFCSVQDPASCGRGAVCVNGRCGEKCFDTTVRQANEIQLDELFRCDYRGEQVLESINNVPTSPFREVEEMTFSVQVTDANDPPVLSGCPLAINIAKNLASQQQELTNAGLLDSRVTDEDRLNVGTPFNLPYSFSLQGQVPSFVQFNTNGNFLQYVPDGNPLGATLGNIGDVYSFELLTSDGSASSVCQVTATVIEENTAPVLNNAVTAPIAENSESGAGEVVVLERLQVVDPDDNEDFTFSTSPNPFFVLDEKTGRITLGSSSVDYESLSPDFTYKLIVRVKDRFGAEDVGEVSIPVTDVNEPPFFLPVPPIQVAENNNVNAVVLSQLADVYAFDPDVFASDASWKELTFSLVGCGTPDCPFTVDASSGAIRVTRALNFEADQTSWEVQVIARDGQGLQASTKISVQVTDVNEPPRFTLVDNSVSVPEGELAENQDLLNMLEVVFDEDTYDTPATMTFEITAGNENNNFIIQDGILKGNNNFLLDYEQKQEYPLVIQVSDSGSNTASSTVIIRVANVNDVKLTAVQVEGNQALQCTGDTKVVLTGRNLGFKDDAVWAKTVMQVQYTSDETGVTYECTDVEKVVSGDNTQIRCTTQSGVGSSFTWSVTVSVADTQVQGDVSAPFPVPGLGYDTPAILSVLGASEIPTRGESALTIRGTCIGSELDFGAQGFQGYPSNTFLSYCNTLGTCYRPFCSLSAANELQCTSLAGVGKDLRWVVSVFGRQSASFQAGSYGAPQVTNTSFTVFPSSGEFTTPLVLSGKNFGAEGSVPSQAYALYENSFNTVVRRYSLQGCKVVTAFEQLACDRIVPGMGKNMKLIVTFGDQSNDPSIGGVLVEYERPLISLLSGEGVQGASTVGGQRVIVKGSGFGPTCGKASSGDGDGEGTVSCDILRTTYTRGSERKDGSRIVYTSSCAITKQDAEMECITAPGTGKDHVWTFEIGGHVITFTKVLTSYEVPTVGGYEGPGSKDAATTGNQEVIIKGSNFGPINGAPVVARYGREENPTEFVARNCSVVTENEKVVCYTVEGAGDDLKWTLEVDGQESRAEVTSYGDPVIFDFDGGNSVDVNEFLNGGDEDVILRGANFGPAVFSSLFLESVTFGPPSNPRAYSPSCKVLDHDEILCTTPPGMGRDLRWRVQVKGQESKLSTRRTNYVLPRVKSTSRISGPTDGGYALRMEVDGMPICDREATISVQFGDSLLDYSGYFDELFSVVIPVDPLTACPLSLQGKKYLDFEVPEMTGDASQLVRVQLSSKLFSETYTSNEFSFTFDRPVIETVYAEPIGDGGLGGGNSCQGDYRVTLRGRNFCKSSACCQVNLNGKQDTYVLQDHSHRVITLCTSQTGLIFVQCGDYKTDSLSFNAESPFIFQTTTSQGTALKDIQYPTRASGGDTITIWGLYFGESQPLVSIGEWNATVLEHEGLECDDERIPPHNFGSLLNLDVQCWRTVVRVPDGHGKENPIVVKSAGGDQTSLANNVFEFVNYAKPEISALIGQFPAPTEGGGEMVIRGSNFGLYGQVEILELSPNGIFGSVWNLVGYSNCTSYNHEELVCSIPAGEGKGLGIRVVVGNQDTRSQDGSFVVNYEAPSLESVKVSGEGRTAGGELITIQGSNFGRKYLASCPSFTQEDCTPVRPQVLVGDNLCEFVSNSQTEIVCKTPPGEGRGLSLAVNVRAQQVVSEVSFDYAAPSIRSFTPVEANTDGKGPSGLPQVMVILGDNFGVDETKVLFEVGGEAFVVAERRLEDGLNDFDQDETNHTALFFSVPEFRGKDISIRVVVAGQETTADTLFSYKKPSVTGIVTIDADGNEQEWSGGSTEDIQDKFFSEDESSRRENRLRLLAAVADEKEFVSVNPAPCDRHVLNRGFSWKTVRNDIFEGNFFSRTVVVYADEMCSESAVLFSVETEGGLRDLNAAEESVALDCTTTYVQETSSIQVVPQSPAGVRFLSVGPACCDASWDLLVGRDITACLAQSGCPSVSSLKSVVHVGSNYGVYFFTERQNLYFSRPVSSLNKLLSSPVFELPSTASAVRIIQQDRGAPQGPTSGCFRWEPYREYLRRRREALDLTGSALNVYRKCENKALMSLTGNNFSTNLFNASQQIRVFFYSDKDPNAVVEFEAATTSSPGDHQEVCTSEEGCVHEHEKITFQIPPGYGRNLKIRIQVGNQIGDAQNATNGESIKFHYNEPTVDFSTPGSLFAGYGFQNADGAETVEFLGEDFGGVSSPATVLMNGRVCSNATWRSGDEDEEGKPFMSCIPDRDVTGPRSLFVCVAGQVAFSPGVKTDAQLLVEADRIRGTEGSEARRNALLRDTASLVNSRCKSTYDAFGNAVGKMGSVSELCVSCPLGSICNEPDVPFTPPKAQAGFFRLDIPVFTADGQVSERAERRCPRERWDKALLEVFPTLVLSETCSDYVSCEPSKACEAGNQCSEGYQYAFQQCTEKRYGNDAATNNTCGIVFNPFTGTYEGIQSDCNPNPEESCTPDKPEECSVCTVVYDEETGPRGVCSCSMPKQCSLCSLFSHFRLNNQCKECPKNPALIIAVFVGTVILALIGGWYMNKRRINLALFSVALDYLQVLAVFSSVNIAWPESLLAFFNLLSFFNLNIDIAAPECLVPTLEYETKWFLMETLPLAVIGLLILVHLTYSLFKLIRLRRRAKLSSHVSRLFAVFLIVMYVLYLNVTRKSLDIFNCNPLPLQDDGYTYTSFTSLSCDGGSLCRCGEGIQARLVPLAAVFLVVYSFGFPLGVFLAIRRYKTLIQEDQYLRASGTGDSRATNPRAYDTRKRFSALYMHFKPDRPFWIITILARKFLVAAGALMFRSNTTFQLSVILLVLFTSFCIHLQYRPYLSTGERSIVLRELDEKAERGLDLEEFKPYLDMQRKVQECVKKSKELERKAKTRMGGKELWQENDKLAQQVRKVDLRRRAQELFFDYNTVEAILLASAIFICLGGVMFSSGRFENRPDIVAQRDFIAYLVIICVILTFLYLLIVIAAEIYPTLTVQNFTRCLQVLQRRKPEEHEVVDLDADMKFADNPMFDGGFQPPKNGKLRAELERNQEELDRIAEQNEELRRELAQQKKEEQMSSFNLFGVPSPFSSRKKKTEFKPTKSKDNREDSSDHDE